MANPVGRPSDYTPELAAEICEAVVNSIKGLKRICAEHDHFPAVSTIQDWFEAHPEFRARYVRAKEIQGHECADMAWEELDEFDLSQHCSHQTGEAGASVNHVNNKARHLQWMAGRLAPKDSTLNINADVEVTHSFAELSKRAAERRSRGGDS